MLVDAARETDTEPAANLARRSDDSLAALQRHFVLIGLLLLLSIAGLAAWEAQRIERDGLTEFRQDMLHLSEVLDETLSRQLQSLDSALLLLRAEYIDDKSDMGRMLALLRQGPLRDVDVFLMVLDKEGRVVFSDVPGAGDALEPQDLAHLRGLVGEGADRLRISEMAKGSPSKRWGLQLTRPVLGRNGAAQGSIVLLLGSEQLTRFVQAMDMASDTILSVFSSDGVLLSRSRDLERFRNNRLPQTQLRDFRSESQGFSLRPSVLDGVERGIAHRWIERYSLLLVVARDASTVRAQVAAQQGQMLVLAGSALLLVLLSFALLWRSLQQRRQTAIRLQDANEHLMQAQRIAQLGNWDYELASGSFNWSDETYRIFELDRAARPVSYADALARFHPDDRDEADQAYSRALKRLEPYELTHRLLMSDGRVKWIHARGSVSLGEAGKPVRLVGTVQDISERKRDEAARAALTRERLLLLESTGEGIYGVDGEGRCSFINQSGAQMLGYRVDELIGRNIHEVTHHRHADGRQYPRDDCPVFLATVSGEPCRRDDEVFWRKDGGAVPVEYAAHPIRDGERVVGAVVTFADISRRKTAELELRIAEAAFQTQEGMFVTDESGTILRVNKAFTEITGYSAAEALGKNLRFRSSGRQDALFYAAMWERIKSSGAWKGEIWNRRKNGEIYPESVTITAVRGEDAGVTHYVATIHDISERKAAEERIRNLAFVDTLTQLPNRRLLMERLNHALASSARSQSHAALMFIDLDNFKWLNDSYGHDVGDLLLREVAARLQACVREIDTVARLGGDEFVVMLESLSGSRNEAVQQASQIGKKILEALNEPYELDGLSHQSTASIGATVFSGQSETAEALLKQADIAMYKAKAGGRNAVCVYEPAWLDGEEAPREA